MINLWFGVMAILLALGIAAFGQGSTRDSGSMSCIQTFPGGLVYDACGLSIRTATVPVRGSDDVGRAMSICDRHELPSNLVPHIPSWPKEWESCYKIHDKWNQGETARQQRERKAQEERDRAFVQSVAEKQ